MTSFSGNFGNPGNKKGPSLRDLMRNNGPVPPAFQPLTPAAAETDSWGDDPVQDTLGGGALGGPSGGDDFGGGGAGAETEQLLAENEDLRGLNTELREAIENLRAQLESGGQGGDDQTALLDQMLEEKSETIRTLHVRIKDLEQMVEETGAGGPAVPAADREELAAMMDEIERERCQLEQERQTLDDDRRQLREDEEAMMRQMREMELQMAKERAELARQRNELQRLHAEIRHELELAQRDAAVNERLRMLQRRHTDADQPEGGTATPPPLPGKNKSLRGGPPPKPAAPPTGRSGIFQRFIGGDKDK